MATGWAAGVRFPTEERKFSLLHSLQIRPNSYPASSLGSVPGENRPGSEADLSPLSIAEVKNGGAVPLLRIHLHGVVLN
jgi:hypothetical protein